MIEFHSVLTHPFLMNVISNYVLLDNKIIQEELVEDGIVLEPRREVCDWDDQNGGFFKDFSKFSERSKKYLKLLPASKISELSNLKLYQVQRLEGTSDILCTIYKPAQGLSDAQVASVNKFHEACVSWVSENLV